MAWDRQNLSKHEGGATLVYVALMIFVMLGVIGLSYDLGRHYILSSELQKAADAAAVAGAYQLDPDGDQAQVATRVAAAVTGTPVAQNSQKLGATDGAVGIAAINLLETIPADDDTAISAGDLGPPYNYVEVRTQSVVGNNVFGRLLGQPDQITLEATAVARKGRAVCQVTPLAVCNPAEATGGPGAAFNASDFYGKQILVRQHQGAGTQWAPGNFGFLDVPGFGSGARGLAGALGIGGAPICFGTNVTTEPGQTNGARNALNTRFDMYENPFFKNADRDPNFPPAENVTKGYDTNAGNYCNRPSDNDVFENPAYPDFYRLPRDLDLDTTNRFGNGQWECALYWQTVHPLDPAPAGCGTDTAVPTTAITRFEVYRYEIDNGLIPDSSFGEDGVPQCSSNPPQAPTPGDLSTDRRIITMAVLNCLEHGVQGSITVPAEGYLNGFLTEPVKDTPSDPDRGDIVLEVVGSSDNGAGGIAPVRSRDWVEVVR